MEFQVPCRTRGRAPPHKPHVTPSELIPTSLTRKKLDDSAQHAPRVDAPSQRVWLESAGEQLASLPRLSAQINNSHLPILTHLSCSCPPCLWEKSSSAPNFRWHYSLRVLACAICLSLFHGLPVPQKNHQCLSTFSPICLCLGIRCGHQLGPDHIKRNHSMLQNMEKFN